MATSNILGLRPNFATIPLISSSLALFYAFVEVTIFIPFLQSAQTDPKIANRALRLWWTNYIPYGLCTIFSVVLPGAVAGVYALRHLPRSSLDFTLCGAGAVFSLGHFLFVPPVSKTITAMCDEKVEQRGETVMYQRKWLRLHAWRILFMDVPAVVCFGLLASGT